MSTLDPTPTGEIEARVAMLREAQPTLCWNILDGGARVCIREAHSDPCEVEGTPIANGMCALWDLIALCQSGHFYEDYDDSNAVLRRAVDGFDTIREALYALQPTSALPGRPTEGGQ